MIQFLRRFLHDRPPPPTPRLAPRRLVLTGSSLREASHRIHEAARSEREGIVYFIGVVGRDSTLAIACIAPPTTATRDSVDVDHRGMATVIRAAASDGLQVVGQLHSHPGVAYHSDGDRRGMRIRYDGYFSIVAPRYGLDLPSLAGVDVLVWDEGNFASASPPQVVDEV